MSEPPLKHIGVLTSGGDAPGMNAFIRAVVRTAAARGCKVTGIVRGFQGMLDEEYVELNSRSVGGIMRHGGTVIQTSRCLQFREVEYQKKAIDNLQKQGIQGVVVGGGNGSMNGVKALHALGYPAVGAPASIDNDVYGSETCIGVDTALTTIVEAIDKLKDTASSLSRAFLVEVMGRDCGWLALASGVASGAEVVLVPEQQYKIEDLVQHAKETKKLGKPFYIIVAAEALGLALGEKSDAFVKAMEESGFTVRTTVLGHIQRGGSPTPSDRIVSTRFGAAAAEALIAGRSGIMVGWQKSKMVEVPIETVISNKETLDPELLSLSPIMAQ